jgi:hypothetical protein
MGRPARSARVGTLALSCTLLLACGRLGFGDLGDGGGGGGGGGGGSGVHHDAPTGLDAEYMTPTLAGSDSSTTGGGSDSLPVFQPFGANELVVIAIAIQGAGTVTQIGDSVGNNYLEHNSTATSPAGSVALWYSATASASDGSPITITFTSVVHAGAGTYVFDGIDQTSPLDNTSTESQQMSSPASAPAFTTSLPHELLAAVLHDDGGDTSGLDGSAFPPYVSPPVPQSGDSSAYLITTSPTTYPGAEFAMSTTGTVCAVTTAFRPAAL